MSALNDIFNIITPARGDDPDKPIYYIITQIAAIQENLPTCRRSISGSSIPSALPRHTSHVTSWQN